MIRGKRSISFISFVCAFILLGTTALPPIARAAGNNLSNPEENTEIDGYQIQHVADATNLPDGSHHSEGQNYGWASTEYSDYIYIGTGYNIIGNAASRMADMLLSLVPEIDEGEAAVISQNLWDLVFNEQLPDQSRAGHAILLKIHKETNEVTIITPDYDESTITGYRTAAVFNDTVYFVAVSPQGGIVKVDPETNTSSIVYQPEEGTPGAYRGLAVYDGQLLLSFGTSTGAMIQASSSPEVKESWKKVADEVDFDYLLNPSTDITAIASGGGIWEMVEFNGSLYVSIATSVDPDTGEARGFSLFRGDKNGESWTWTPIIGDQSQGAAYPFGLGRTTAITLTLFVFDGYLYLGEFNNTPLNLISAATGDLEPLYNAINQPVNLYRMDANENIELVIGDPMEGIPGPIGNFGSGFDDNNIQYIWWMQEYDGKLFLGTFDISTVTDVLNINLEDEEEFHKRLHQVINLILSILSAFDAEEDLPTPTSDINLEVFEFDSSTVIIDDEIPPELKGYLAQLPKEELEILLHELITLSQENLPSVIEGDSFDIAALEAYFQENIEPLLASEEFELDPELLPIIEEIQAIFEQFFGFIEQLEYLQVIKDYAKEGTMGYDVFYSADGVNFDVLTRDGLGHPESYGLRTFLRTSDALYLTTSGPFNGFEVWKLQSEADLYQESSDAALEYLGYSVNGRDRVLIQGFSPDTFEYNVFLPSTTALDSAISLIAETNDPLATITKNDGVTLKDGEGTAVIEVTAEDGTVLTYSVSFTVGKRLPDTGGEMNSTIYSMASGITLLAAGALLFTRRRNSKLN